MGVFRLFNIFFVSAILIASSGCGVNSRPEYQAINGVLDLRGVNLESGPVIPLAGEWRFYNRSLVTPGTEQGNVSGVIKVPGPWNGQVVAGEKIPPLGYGTYELTILLDDPGFIPGIHMPQVGTSYRLFVNDREIARSGEPGVSAEKTAARIIRRVLPVIPENGKIHILLQAANYSHRNGGFRDAIRFGSLDDVQSLRESRLFKELILIGAFWIMGLYHLGLFTLRPGSKSALWFFVFATSVSFRSLFLGEAIIYNLVPDIPYPVGLSLEYLFGYLTILGFTCFLVSLFPDEFPRRHGQIATAFIVLCMTTLLPGNSVFSSYVILIFEAFTVLLGIYGGINLLRSVLAKRSGATVLLAGWGWLFITFLHDLFLFNLFHDGLEISVLGVLGFIFTQTYVLSSRSAMAYRQAETLSAELEDRVIQRTKELSRAKEESEIAYRARTEFLANMSHEIRTPMNAMLGITELLEESRLDPEQKRHLRRIRTASRTMFQMIVDVLDLSKLERGEIDLSEEEFSPVDCLQDLYTLFSRSENKSNIDFRINIDERVPPFLLGDVYRLSQVLSNLLSNSFKFTDSGYVELGVLFLESSFDRATLQFYVKDTGVGIPPEKLESIFDSFIRFEHGFSKRRGGAGLGLALTKRIVTLMGGNIRAESQPEKGSVFFVTSEWKLPKPGKKAETTNREPSRKEDSPTILIADDIDDNLFLLERFLLPLTEKITVTRNGLEALNAFRKSLLDPTGTPFDAIILDIQMPVMDGYEAAREIRKLEKETGTGHVPLVTLTAHVEPEDRAAAKEAGFDHHMKKPFHKKEIQSAIRKIIADFRGNPGPSF